jgi:2-succinyl-6-hydroxy-2,4-cyclohexadiene-1-carboxylate synthase
VPELRLEDVALSYADEGQGCPVTLLHGFTQDRHSWDELLALLPSGWRWIRVDLRGHGGTRTDPAAPHTMTACMKDLDSLWTQLGVEASHLVGYSLGGRLALQVAARMPGRLRSLVTIGAHAGMAEAERPGRRAADEKLAASLESGGMAPFVEYWSALPLFSGQARRGAAFVEAVRRQRLANDPQGLARSLRGMGGGSMEPVWNRLSDFGEPALFVAGAEDERYVRYAQRLAGMVPKGAAAIVPGAGHAVHLEQPDAMASLLEAHLSTR